MTPKHLAELHPRLFHMAFLGSWPSIERHGLLSTSALLDLFEVDGTQREEYEARHRPEPVQLIHPVHGKVWLRDQKPMDDLGLDRALAGTGLSPADWYRILNRKVFFWATEDRLNTMLNARAYREIEHLVVLISTTALLVRHQDAISISPINSGATKPMPAPRGADTFQPVAAFTYADWKGRRAAKDVVVEVAVEYAVPNLAELVIELWRMRGSVRLA